MSHRYDIAIIGMGCVFPKANNIEQYWKNIQAGDSYFSEMPKSLWRLKSFYSPERSVPDKTYTLIGSFIEGFEFPFHEYKLPPNTLKGVDPCQLLTLEATREALQDAGLSARHPALAEGITVIGASGVDLFAHSTAYLHRHGFFKHVRRHLEGQGVPTPTIDQLFEELGQELKERGHSWNPAIAAVGAITSSLSNRVAQVFGVRGCNMTVDGACASSFAALDTACHALMAGDARIAIAGGADLGTNPAIYIGFSRVEGLSLTGTANPFDHTADGLVIGEGVGMVVLKRLEDALSDGDRIRGVLRGTGTTSDGAGQAIYAPSVEGRAAALRYALESAEIEPHRVQFVEAHATSTIVGDANEYDAISTIYAPGRDVRDPLRLGSVKQQIGHLKAAAGMAGLIKTVLAMENGLFPHMPRFTKLTPGAQCPSDALLVPTAMTPWEPRPDGARVAAVTSSGFGGVNYHVIIEQAERYASPAPRTIPERAMAVVGVSCRVADADTPEKLWENITTGVNMFSRVNPEELGWEDHFHTGPEGERITTDVVCRMAKYDFPLLRHKIFPNAMSQIAPTQLLGVDLADRLLAARGLDLAQPKNVGVSVGSMHDDNFPEIFDAMTIDEYCDSIRTSPSAKTVARPLLEAALRTASDAVRKARPPVTEHTLPGWMTNVIAGRMANKLNLHGPNFTVDTACSSGLGALLPAMYQLMFGNVEMMITGGLNQQLSDTFTCGVCALGAVARSEARPYDAEGNGFLIGEGGVLYLVKRLADAERDGDNVLAVIRAVGGSSEADSKSMVAPSLEAVRRAMQQGLALSGVQIERIGVAETHGSANLLSDLVEARALAAELRPDGVKAGPVQITAIKSHVGHLYGGSGASSLLSVIKTLRTGTVPGIRGLKNPRPEIAAIADQVRPRFGTEPLAEWADAGVVNSLGLGGANYFVVVTAPRAETALTAGRSNSGATQPAGAVPTQVAPCAPSRAVRLKDESSSDIFFCVTEQPADFASAIGRALQQNPIPQFISDGSQPGARLTATFASPAELKTKLGNALRLLESGHGLSPLESQGVFAAAIPAEGTKEQLVFCFPGQGTHYIGMGRFLYEKHASFRAVLDEVDALARRAFDFPLLAHIYGDEKDPQIAARLGTLKGAQTALYAMELGLGRVIEELGVVPDAMIGHSFGEISALTFAGTWNIEQGYQVVAARIRAAEIVISGGGPKLGMMSVICSDEQRDAILGLVGEKVVLTNINGPGRFILSGELESVKRTVAVAESFGVEARLLPIGAAFHSRFMEPAREPFYKALCEIPCGQPRYPILSTITGEYLPQSGLTPEKLARHLSNQLVTKLNLPREIDRLYSDGARHFVEVGPGWSMTKMIAAILPQKPHRAAPMIHPKVGDEETFRRARAFLIALGHLGSAAERKNLPGIFTPDFTTYLQTREPAVLALIEEVHTRYSERSRERAAVSVGLPAPTTVSKSTWGGVAEAPHAAPNAPVPLNPVAADQKTWIERVRHKLVATTGYPPEMLEEHLDLEADLGVDSVQRAEIWMGLLSEHALTSETRPSGVRTIAQLASALAALGGGTKAPSPQAPAAAAKAAVTAATTAARKTSASSGADVGTWVERVRQKLVATTGYPPEMLEEHLDLEADLGVDSVQRAEIWMGLLGEHGLTSEARPSGVRTIAQLASALASLGGAPAAAFATPAAEPATASGSADLGTWVERVRQKLVATTGYPPEMLEAHLDLEADLGVDSVQRAEIWMGLLGEHGLSSESRPNGVRTITELAAALASLGSGKSGHQASAIAAPVAVAAKSGGLVIEELRPGVPASLFATSCQPVTDGDVVPFACRRVLIIAGKRDRWVSKISTRLAKKDINTAVIEAETLRDMSPLEVITRLADRDTVIYLAHREVYDAGTEGHTLQLALERETNLLFAVFQRLMPSLQQRPLRVIVPVAMDGAFGAFGGREPRWLGAFPAGFVRSLARELPQCQFQLVDVGDDLWLETIDACIGQVSKQLEMGMTAIGRVAPMLSRIAPADVPCYPVGQGDLVLVTGGARGIVFECVTAVAERTGCRLLLTGRTSLPEGSPAWLETSPEELAQVLRSMEIELVKSGSMVLGAAKKVSANAKSQWEVHRNLKRLAAAGIDARYEVCDVADPTALTALVQRTQEHDVIRGLVHGAGVQRSRRLEELQQEGIQRTISTKLCPLFALIDVLDWSQMNWLSAFGSVTGVFGNAGQTDYALANDLMGWLVSCLGARYTHLVAQTVDWTAWVGTGMVTDEEAKRFAQVGLVPLEIKDGVALYLAAVGRSGHTKLAAFNAEAGFGAGRTISAHATPGRPLTRLNGGSDGQSHTRAELVPHRDIYLGQHLVEGAPVVPGTFVSEIFAEATVSSGQVLMDLSFRRPLWVREASLEVEVVPQDVSLLLVPARRPELADKALANLAFASCRLGPANDGEALKLKAGKKDVEALVEAGAKNAASFYSLLDSRFTAALVTGPIFRGVRATEERGERFMGLVTMTPEALALFGDGAALIFDPVLADMAVQVGCASVMQKLDVLAIPFEIGCLQTHAKRRQRDAVVICRTLDMGLERTVLDVAVRELEGQLLLTMDRLVLKTIARGSGR